MKKNDDFENKPYVLPLAMREAIKRINQPALIAMSSKVRHVNLVRETSTSVIRLSHPFPNTGNVGNDL